MKEKLQQLMKSEGLTSSRMAEILRIQPSGISHILAGRNKPGFDLLQKILRRFPRVNPDWLLLDSEQMYRTGNPKSSSSTNGTDAGNGRTDTGLFGAEPEQRSNTAGSVAPSTQTAENDNELSKQTDTVLQTLAVQKRTSKKFPYFVSSERPRRRIPSAQSLKDGVVIFQQIGSPLIKFRFRPFWSLRRRFCNIIPSAAHNRNYTKYMDM